MTALSTANGAFDRRGIPLSALILAAFGPLGLLLPTSHRATLTFALLAAAHALLFACLAVVLAARAHHVSEFAIVVSLIIPLSLLAGTMLSPLWEAHYLGIGTPYVLLSLVFVLPLRKYTSPAGVYMFVLGGINIVAVTAAILTLLKWPPATGFLITHYSVFMPDLVSSMLDLRKPVLTFGTHSLAAFAYWLLFYLNWVIWKRRRNRLFLVACCLYVGLQLALRSNTGFLVALVSICTLFGHLLRKPVCIAVLGMLAVAAIIIGRIDALDAPAIQDVRATFASQRNGFLARYGGNDSAIQNLRFLADHPFRPIGAGTSTALSMIGDSGPIEHLLRGSVPLAAAVYGGFWMFLRRNVASTLSRRLLFVMFMAFEFGFSNLVFFRTLYLLPFAVCCLNSMEGEPGPND